MPLDPLIWSPPPKRLVLSHDIVHVWRAELDIDLWGVNRYWYLLSEDERDRATRFHFAQDRNRFVVGRGILRVLLGRYLDELPTQLRFGYSVQGKPFLLGQADDKQFSFNLSHSQGIALYVVGLRRAVGIDVEAINSTVDYEPIAKRFFSPSEQGILQALPADLQRAAFFIGWTQKEAYLKACGLGFSLPPDRVTVSLCVDDPRLLYVDAVSDETSWSFRVLDLGPKYAATVVIQGTDWTMCCWDWTSG